jgi:fatty acid desaturase
MNFLKDPQLLRDVKKFSALRPFQTVWAIFFTWVSIALAIWITILFPHYWLYPFTLIFIGTRQHALGILFHEAAHFRLFSQRWLNDFCGDFFAAFPLGLSVPSYRTTHLRHHAHNATELDPDLLSARHDSRLKWPQPKKQGIFLLVRDFFGTNPELVSGVMVIWGITPRLFKITPLQLSKITKSPVALTESLIGRSSEEMKIPLGEWARFLGFYGLVIAALSFTHTWHLYLFFWLIPQFTMLAFIFRVRGAAEHQGLPNEHALNETRTIKNPSRIEKIIFAPLNIHYHLEHHLFPSVPFYHLPALHRRLNAIPEYARLAHQTENYFGRKNGLFAELLSSGQ